MALSILPDIDLLIPGLMHRGPAHSLIIITLVSAPFLAKYGTRAIPYLLTVGQHVFIEDYFILKSALLGPLSTTSYEVGWREYEVPPEFTSKILLDVSELTSLPVISTVQSRFH